MKRHDGREGSSEREAVGYAQDWADYFEEQTIVLRREDREEYDWDVCEDGGVVWEGWVTHRLCDPGEIQPSNRWRAAEDADREFYARFAAEES